MKKKEEWPEVGDHVIATVNRITDYGVYVMLDEYGKEGLLHISEVSTGWVKNIRDFAREGQKVVLSVLRVNSMKNHVDLSLKRVGKSDKRRKIMSWKKERRADSLLRSASDMLNLPIEEVYDKAGFPIEEKFGSLYDGLERVVREGTTALLEIGVPAEVAKAITETAREKIRIQEVKIEGVLELKCTKPNGVFLIKEALLSAQKFDEEQEVSVLIYTISPPKYHIEVLAEDYKEAERVLEASVQAALGTIKKIGGQGNFQREK